MAHRIQLITRADDAGLTAGTNHAIAAACDAGTIRNVGLLAVGPVVEQAADLLRDMPSIALGLHFALNCEWDHPLWAPLASHDRVRSLLDERHALPRTTSLLHAQSIDLSQVILEAEAQLSRLRQLGLHLTYLDDHMACSWLPGVKKALHEFATREGLIFGPSEFRSLPHTAGSKAPADPRDSARNAEAGIYLHFTHPAYDDAEFRAFRASGLDVDEMIRTRAAEAQLWGASSMVADLERAGITACRYDEVFKVGDRLPCANW